MSRAMTPSKRACYVYVALPGSTGFVTAGHFEVSTGPDGEPVGRFDYARPYLERPDAVALDAVALDPVELVPGHGPFETQRLDGFFGALRDAMPDHWGRSVNPAEGDTAADKFRFLLEVPDDRAGALAFGESGDPPEPFYEFAGVADLDELQAQVDRVTDAERPAAVAGAGAPPVAHRKSLRTALGGARPKTVVEHQGALWVAKLSRPGDRWSHPRVEHGALNLARECGLAVADSELHRVGGRDVLLVRRFDREKVEGGYHRNRMVSALTLLQSDDSVDARKDWSYLSVADRIRWISARPEPDLRELFARMCFNAAISNTDDHPRNHAVVADADGWRLSPAFDLMPGPQIAADRRDLAMSCGPFGRYANRENLLGAHEWFLLSRDSARGIFDRIVETVRERWPHVMRDAGVDKGELDRIAPAFLYPGLFHDAVT